MAPLLHFAESYRAVRSGSKSYGAVFGNAKIAPDRTAPDGTAPHRTAPHCEKNATLIAF